MSSESRVSYLVVGSGVFGVSTAYYLSKIIPDASIVVVDRSTSFPCSLAASHDLNKIIRADYDNLFYCGLALEARELWKLDPFWAPFYHQSGMIIIESTGLGRRILKNYEELNDYLEASIISPAELKAAHDGLFAGADYTNVKEIFYNPASGWAEATSAVRAAVKASQLRGVEFVQGDIEQLTFGENGQCTGVKCKDGRTLTAEKVILSTGAGTAQLLAQSAPDRPEIQSGDRITAAAVVTGTVKLNPQQMSRFRKSPIFVHGMENVLGEVLPPTPDGLLKFCVDVSFKNSVYHHKSGQKISAPPDSPDQDQLRIPDGLKTECSHVVRGIFGKELLDSQFESFRICWDGITPNQDFIISSHPRCDNLHIATGGSFHGWKFLPIIGKYVVQMLIGELDENLRRRWAWDRDQQGSAHETVVPRREFVDLLSAPKFQEELCMPIGP